MYKVLFADDEVMNHQLLENLVEWNKLGFEIAGTATDGVETIRMYEEIHPDVIFMDIRMPFMDGLECIRMIREEDLAVRIVIVSAYGDFTYAQRAIQYGVQDFLVKPVSRLVLNQLVEKIRLSLEKREKLAEGDTHELELQYLKIKRDIMEEKKHLLEGKYEDFFKKVKSAVYVRCMTAECESIGLEETERVGEELKKALAEAGSTSVWSMTESAGRVLVLSGKTGIGTEALERMKNSGGRILDFFVTGENSDAADLSAFFYEIYHMENPGFYRTDGTVCRKGQIGCFKDHPEEFMEEIPFHELFVHGGTEELNAFFHRMIEQAESEFWNPLILKNRILDVLVTLKLKFKEYYPRESFCLLRNIRTEELKRIDKAAYLEKYTERIAEQMYDFWKKVWEDESREGLVVRKANIYAGEHFTESDFSTQKTADHIGMSRNYFVTVYKETARIGFWDYVTGCRIDRAKELLLSTEETAGNIARSVGYESEYHFSRKFKEITGSTPNQYRKTEKSAKKKG